MARLRKAAPSRRGPARPPVNAPSDDDDDKSDSQWDEEDLQEGSEEGEEVELTDEMKQTMAEEVLEANPGLIQEVLNDNPELKKELRGKSKEEVRAAILDIIKDRVEDMLLGGGDEEDDDDMAIEDDEEEEEESSDEDDESAPNPFASMGNLRAKQGIQSGSSGFNSGGFKKSSDQPKAPFGGAASAKGTNPAPTFGGFGVKSTRKNPFEQSASKPAAPAKQPEAAPAAPEGEDGLVGIDTDALLDEIMADNPQFAAQNAGKSEEEVQAALQQLIFAKLQQMKSGMGSDDDDDEEEWEELDEDEEEEFSVEDEDDEEVEMGEEEDDDNNSGPNPFAAFSKFQKPPAAAAPASKPSFGFGAKPVAAAPSFNIQKKAPTAAAPSPGTWELPAAKAAPSAAPAKQAFPAAAAKPAAPSNPAPKSGAPPAGVEVVDLISSDEDSVTFVPTQKSAQPQPQPPKQQQTPAAAPAPMKPEQHDDGLSAPSFPFPASALAGSGFGAASRVAPDQRRVETATAGVGTDVEHDLYRLLRRASSSGANPSGAARFFPSGPGVPNEAVVNGVSAALETLHESRVPALAPNTEAPSWLTSAVSNVQLLLTKMEEVAKSAAEVAPKLQEAANGATSGLAAPQPNLSDIRSAANALQKESESMMTALSRVETDLTAVTASTAPVQQGLDALKDRRAIPRSYFRPVEDTTTGEKKAGGAKTTSVKIAELRDSTVGRLEDRLNEALDCAEAAAASVAVQQDILARERVDSMSQLYDELLELRAGRAAAKAREMEWLQQAQELQAEALEHTAAAVKLSAKARQSKLLWSRGGAGGSDSSADEATTDAASEGSLEAGLKRLDKVTNTIETLRSRALNAMGASTPGKSMDDSATMPQTPGMVSAFGATPMRGGRVSSFGSSAVANNSTVVPPTPTRLVDHHQKELASLRQQLTAEKAARVVLENRVSDLTATLEQRAKIAGKPDPTEVRELLVAQIAKDRAAGTETVATIVNAVFGYEIVGGVSSLVDVIKAARQLGVDADQRKATIKLNDGGSAVEVELTFNDKGECTQADRVGGDSSATGSVSLQLAKQIYAKDLRDRQLQKQQSSGGKPATQAAADAKSTQAAPPAAASAPASPFGINPLADPATADIPQQSLPQAAATAEGAEQERKKSLPSATLRSPLLQGKRTRDNADVGEGPPRLSTHTLPSGIQVVAVTSPDEDVNIDPETPVPESEDDVEVSPVPGDEDNAAEKGEGASSARGSSKSYEDALDAEEEQEGEEEEADDEEQGQDGEAEVEEEATPEDAPGEPEAPPASE